MKELRIVSRMPVLGKDDFIEGSEHYMNEYNILSDKGLLLKEWAYSVKHIGDGFFIVRLLHSDGTTLVNEDGKSVLPHRCRSISIAYNGAVYRTGKCGYAEVAGYDKDQKLLKVQKDDGTWNFVYLDGRTFWPQWYDKIQIEGPFHNIAGQYTKVWRDGKITYVDTKTGIPVTELFFEDTTPDAKRSFENRQRYKQDYVATVKVSGRWRTLLKDGTLV